MLEKVAPFALDEMRVYPPPAKLPFDFGSEEARNAYFVKIRKGLVPTANGRYVRTGALAASMFFIGELSEKRFIFKAGSKSKIARDVVGSFNQAKDTRIPGHINTGWQKLYDTVNFWLKAADEEMAKEVHSVYVEYKSLRRNR